MATKWKNTDDKSKWEAIKERNQDVVTLVGGALLLTGLFFVATLIVLRDELGDESGTVVGVLGNLSLAAGSVMIVDMIMKNRYGDWMPEGEERYREWKETVRKMNRRDWKIGGAAFILAGIYLGIMILGYGYYYSAVSGYMLVITVLVQFLVYEWRIRRFWQKKLDAVTEKTEEEKEELIRQRIEEAREIERESLEKVSRSDQLRIDLITNVSHDLKTPLTSMVGYIELMKKEELSDVMRDYVDVLSERAEKLKEMISSLFSLAKASSGNVELKMESFEMNRLIDQIFADMDDRIRESGLEFVTRKTEESTELVSDNMYCYRICQNLLENTLKYSAKGTRVFVKTSVKSGEGAFGREPEGQEDLPGDHQYVRISHGFYRGGYCGAVRARGQSEEQRRKRTRPGDRQHIYESPGGRIRYTDRLRPVPGLRGTSGKTGFREFVDFHKVKPFFFRSA